MTSRRILYLIDSLSIGGAEMLLMRTVDAARAAGSAVHVAYFTPGPLLSDLEERGVGATRLSTRGLRDPRALPRAYRLMRAWRPDVVHTQLSKSDIVGQPAAWAAGVPVRLLTLHNTDPWRRHRLLSLAYRLATAGAQTRIAVSGAIGDYVVACGGASAQTLHVIENGVDLARFDSRSATPLDLAPWGVPPDAFKVAVIGRLTPQKDHMTFLRAAADLADRLPRAHFLIVGDGELRARLVADAAALGLAPDRLSFTGIIRDIPELMAALDVVVFSSAWEGLPVVLIEAMAMGLPVAATRVGAVPAVIEDGSTGLLIEPGDHRALGDAVARLEDPDLRRRLGAAARRKVEAGFSAEAMLDKLFRLYEGGVTAK